MARDRRAGDGLRDPADRPRRGELAAGFDPAGRGRARTGNVRTLRAVRGVFAHADGGQPADLERRDGVHGDIRGLRPLLIRSTATSLDDRHPELAEPRRTADDVDLETVDP